MKINIFGRPARLAAARRRSANFGERGFTLVEILVVITIIGLIMGLVGPRVLNYLTESKAKAAKIQIDSFASALDLYFLDNGRYPSSLEGLAALVQRPGSTMSWNGPYLKGAIVPNDPWGNAYIYRAPGQHGVYHIMSYGADGQEGGNRTGRRCGQLDALTPIVGQRTFSAPIPRGDGERVVAAGELDPSEVAA